MVNMTKNAYEKLKRRFAQISNLRGASAILEYDALSVMPENSLDDHTGQVVALEETIHHFLTLPETAAWLDEAEADAASLALADRRNLALMRREWVHAACLSAELAGEQKRVESDGQTLHQKSVHSGGWDALRDWYVHAFDVMRAIGQAKQPGLGTATAYDALLDSFSPGLREAALAAPFAALERYLPGLIREAVERQKSEPAPLPLPHVSREKQAELCRRIAKAMNFDFGRGRFDMIDGHPSCGGTSDDTRYTVECHEDDFFYAVYTILHEGGHANYYQGQPAAWRNQPAGGDLGMALHETMSRIMELHVGRSPQFLQYLEREAREVFGMPDDPALNAENMRRLLCRVQPSLIRLDADELTYPAHIILRYKLESAAVNGRIDAADMPRHWDNMMQQLLGVRPASAVEGCLQDTHWPCGYIGYFPAYTLGDIGAAQLFDAACRARPELLDELGRGNFTPLTDWLTENVYGKGALLTEDELFTVATGEPRHIRFYLNHLSTRYLGHPWQEPPLPGGAIIAGPAPAP